MEDLFSLFEKPKNPVAFGALRISIAEPDTIRSWSHGEVKKLSTVTLEATGNGGIGKSSAADNCVYQVRKGSAIAAKNDRCHTSDSKQ